MFEIIRMYYNLCRHGVALLLAWIQPFYFFHRFTGLRQGADVGLFVNVASHIKVQAILLWSDCFEVVHKTQQQWLLVSNDYLSWNMRWIDGDWWNELMNGQIELKCAFVYNIFDREWFSWLPQHVGISKTNLWAFFWAVSPFLVKAIFSRH